MAKCFLCGAVSPGPTCESCAKGEAATMPAPSLADVLKAKRSSRRAPIPDEERTGFEADTAEVSVPPRAEPTLDASAPPAMELEPLPEPPLLEAPAAEDGESGTIQRWNTILDESPVFAGQGAFEVKTPAPPEPGALDVGIQVRFDVPSAPADGEPVVHMLVSLAPFGASVMADRQGPVAHVILALDLSASMNAIDKYPVLTRALSVMFRDLQSKFASEVLVSVVAFAWGSETLVRAVPSSQLDAAAVLRALDSWDRRFTKYTDFAGAMHRAGRIAFDSVKAHRAMPVRIYVLTDGRPQDETAARDVMTRIAKLPVDVHGLAFGDDADLDWLSGAIAGGRGGTVKQVRADTLGDAFGRIGEVAQQVVANRALLDLELRPGVLGGEAFRYRPARYRYPKEHFGQGAHFAADLGTLESGRAYSLLFQLRLRRSKGAESEIGRISLRVPAVGGPRTFERLISIPRHAGTAVMAQDPEVQGAVDVLTALDGRDAAATLRSLRVRRTIYGAERRDVHVLEVIDKAIAELEAHGNLSRLTAAERATLVSHTLTTRVRRTDLPALRTAMQKAAAEIRADIEPDPPAGEAVTTAAGTSAEAPRG